MSPFAHLFPLFIFFSKSYLPCPHPRLDTEFQQRLISSEKSYEITLLWRNRILVKIALAICHVICNCISTALNWTEPDQTFTEFHDKYFWFNPKPLQLQSKIFSISSVISYEHIR